MRNSPSVGIREAVITAQGRWHLQWQQCQLPLQLFQFCGSGGVAASCHLSAAAYIRQYFWQHRAAVRWGSELQYAGAAGDSPQKILGAIFRNRVRRILQKWVEGVQRILLNILSRITAMRAGCVCAFQRGDISAASCHSGSYCLVLGQLGIPLLNFWVLYFVTESVEFCRNVLNGSKESLLLYWLGLLQWELAVYVHLSGVIFQLPAATADRIVLCQTIPLHQ